MTNFSNFSKASELYLTQKHLDDPVADYWHVYSDGTKLPQLFSCDEDYCYGINRLAVSAHRFQLKVIVYALMESHVHAVVKGSADSVNKFIIDYKKALSTRFSHLDQGKISFAWRSITDVNDLRNSIVYVYRNPMEISRDVACWNYRWGIGNIIFNPDKDDSGQSLALLQQRELKRCFGTVTGLPGEWRVQSGLIKASSFVDVKEFEGAFENSTALFFAYLHLKKDDRQRIARLNTNNLVNNLSYKELASKMNRACKDYAGKSWSQCTLGQRLAVAREKIKEREIVVSANLAKLFGLTVEELKKIL